MPSPLHISGGGLAANRRRTLPLSRLMLSQLRLTLSRHTATRSLAAPSLRSTSGLKLSSALPISQLHTSSLRPAPLLSLAQLPPRRSAALTTHFITPVSLSVMQSQPHSGHGHHHHHDNTYLVSKNKNDAGVRITRIGLYVNLGMAIGKGIGGYVFNSQALIADGFHALTDLVSDFMTLATISVALKPATSKYPNGFGKVESFGSLLVSGLLLTGGILMAVQSGFALYSQFFAEAAAHISESAEHSHGWFGLGHSHDAKEMIPDLNAAWLAGGSIVVKEWLYRRTMAIAKERKSSVLASNALHHRIDSLTSIVALVAIGGAHVLNGATWLDPVGGLIVSLMVIQGGWGNSKSAVIELCDASIEDEVKDSVRRSAAKAVEENGHTDFVIRGVEGIKAGQNFLVDVEVAAPASSSLAQLSSVEASIRERLGNKVRGLRRVKVKFVPAESTDLGFSSEFIPIDVSPRSSPEPEDEHDHDHDHSHSNGHSSTAAKDKATKRR